MDTPNTCSSVTQYTFSDPLRNMSSSSSSNADPVDKRRKWAVRDFFLIDPNVKAPSASVPSVVPPTTLTSLLEPLLMEPTPPIFTFTDAELPAVEQYLISLGATTDTTGLSLPQRLEVLRHFPTPRMISDFVESLADDSAHWLTDATLEQHAVAFAQDYVSCRDRLLLDRASTCASPATIRSRLTEQTDDPWSRVVLTVMLRLANLAWVEDAKHGPDDDSEDFPKQPDDTTAAASGIAPSSSADAKQPAAPPEAAAATKDVPPSAVAEPVPALAPPKDDNEPEPLPIKKTDKRPVPLALPRAPDPEEKRVTAKKPALRGDPSAPAPATSTPSSAAQPKGLPRKRGAAKGPGTPTARPPSSSSSAAAVSSTTAAPITTKSGRQIPPTQRYPAAASAIVRKSDTGATVDLTNGDDTGNDDNGIGDDDTDDDDDKSDAPVRAREPRCDALDGSHPWLLGACLPPFGQLGIFRYHLNMTTGQPVPPYDEITAADELAYAESQLFLASSADIATTTDDGRPVIEGHGVVILKALNDKDPGWRSADDFKNGFHRLPHEIRGTLQECGKLTSGSLSHYFAKDKDGYYVLLDQWDSYDVCLKLRSQLRNAWRELGSKPASSSSSSAIPARRHLRISDSRLRRAIEAVGDHRLRTRNFLKPNTGALSYSLGWNGTIYTPAIARSQVLDLDSFYDETVFFMTSVLEACRPPPSYDGPDIEYKCDMDSDTDFDPEEDFNPCDWSVPDRRQQHYCYFETCRNTRIPHASVDDDPNTDLGFPHTRPTAFDKDHMGFPLDANNASLHCRRNDYRGWADLRPYVFGKSVGRQGRVRFSVLSFLDPSGRIVLDFEVRRFSDEPCGYDRDGADCILYDQPITVAHPHRKNRTTLVVVAVEEAAHSRCPWPHQLYASMVDYIDEDTEYADILDKTGNPDYNEEFLASAGSLEFDDVPDSPDVDMVTADDVGPLPPKGSGAAPRRPASSGGNSSTPKSHIGKAVDLTLLITGPHDADPTSEHRRMLDDKLTNDGDRRLYQYLLEVMAMHHIGARDNELPRSGNANYRCHVQGPCCTGNGRQVCMHCSLNHHSLAYTICANCQPLHAVNMAFDAVLALRHGQLTRSHFEHVTRLAARTYFAGKPDLVDHLAAVCGPSGDPPPAAAASSSSDTKPSADFLKRFENFSHRVNVPPVDSAEYLQRRVRLLTAMTARAQAQLDSVTPKRRPKKRRGADAPDAPEDADDENDDAVASTSAKRPKTNASDPDTKTSKP